VPATTRAAAGLPRVDVIPSGSRNARSNGVPLQRYRRDQLSRGYHRRRAAQVADAAADAQARRDHARQIAADVIRTHGYQIVVEETSIAAWSRSWGRAVAAFTPGLLVAAIDREARAVAAIAGSRDRGVRRVATRTTAMSQHCPCGTRVAKALADRVHVCPACGLCADRDAVAAVLASFVITSEDVVDYDATSTALAQITQLLHRTDPYQGWQGAPSESTDLSAREGSFLACSTSTPDSVAVARRIVGTAAGPILNEPGMLPDHVRAGSTANRHAPRNGPTWLVSLRDNP
jgi:Putative transposase DNA-binding domain